MSDTFDSKRSRLALDGCASKPLANYLKALGVLRLVQSPSNHVEGLPADAGARGAWESERFVIHTWLDCGSLERFFLEDYAPSPIIAPWNGGSGFYLGDNRDGFLPLVSQDVAPRFEAISTSILTASTIIDDWGLRKRPEPRQKAAFVASLRAQLSDAALEWTDAALALTGGKITFPQLLGTGGNDGRLDFTNNFMQRLVSPKGKCGLFNALTGSPMEGTNRLLRTSLFGEEAYDLRSDVMGQYSPGSAGPNGSTGFEGKAKSNPWDFVLALEGAIMFAGSATRRYEGSRDSGASFPFTVRTTGAGSGVIKSSDEKEARAEFWAPLWSRFASCPELIGLLREGRAIMNGRTAKDGLDFARAAASLGTSRGLESFERYAFVMRSGRAYLATPLGRRQVTTHEENAVALIADLDTGHWLARTRTGARAKDAPSRAREALQQLEDSLFQLTESNSTAGAVQNVLVSIGRLVEWLQTSDKAKLKIPPPPRLSPAWIRRADDRSPEFRVAAALASIGWRALPNPIREGDGPGSQVQQNVGQSRGTTASSDSSAQTVPLSVKRSKDVKLPMAHHFAWVEPLSVFSRSRQWSAGKNRAMTVWTPGSLVSNLNAVLERRLIEQAIQGIAQKPLGSAASGRLGDVAAFLSSDFDDSRCALLLAGLVWASPARLSLADWHKDRHVMPFSYSALKPIFTVESQLRALAAMNLVPSDPEFRLPIPPGLVRLLCTGRIDKSVRLALSRCRSSGMPSPFEVNRLGVASTDFGSGLTGDRLAASLLVPLDQFGLKRVVSRAYPYEKENEDES